MDSLVIGSRLDTDVNANACRLAFSGRLVERFDPRTDQGRVKTYTRKEKSGIVCRLGDPHRRNDDGKIVRYEVFGSDLFKKETNMTQFVGLLVETDRGVVGGDGQGEREVGTIQSSFGTSGKFRVSFPGGTEVREGDALHLRFKRYANDPRKAMHQDGAVSRARVGTRLDPPPSTKKKKQKKKNNNAMPGVVANGGNNNGNHGPRDDPGTAAAGTREVENGKHGDRTVRVPAANKNQIGAAAAAAPPFVPAGNTNNGLVVGEIVKLKGEPTNDGKATIAIVSGFFHMEDDIRKHKGRRVISATTGEAGVVDGSFGKVGKCKVLFRYGISALVGAGVELLPS